MPGMRPGMKNAKAEYRCEDGSERSQNQKAPGTTGGFLIYLEARLICALQ
jgi:hypothetical protein